MKSHSPPSLPPIFVSDKDVDSDDAEEEDCVDRTISLVGQHTSAQHKKGQSSNGVGIWIWTRHGKGNVNWREKIAWTQHRALHVHQPPTYTQERLAVVPVARRIWRVRRMRIQGKAE